MTANATTYYPIQIPYILNRDFVENCLIECMDKETNNKEEWIMYKDMTTNLMVESVDESVAFYQDVLGFSVVASVPSSSGNLQFAIMAKDDLSLMFQERSNLIEEYPTLATEKVQPSVTLYIIVDNFADLYQELKGTHEILCDIHETFYGAKEFAVADNNGYVLTFAEHKAADAE